MSADLQPHIQRARVLLEALPYMQGFRGATFLIKLGGSVLDDPRLCESLLRDIVFLEVVGINPVLVHGGGKAINQALARHEIEPKFVGGLRVTDAAVMRVVEETLGELVNPLLVKTLNGFGGKGLGINGKEVFTAVPTRSQSEDGSEVDLGFVGEVSKVNVTPVRELLLSERVPVVSPLGRRAEDGHAMNINADTAASALACALRVDKLIYLSDVRGVLRDPADDSTLITSMSRVGSENLIRDGVIKGGMIPKVRSALDAISAGVGKVHLIDGRIPHSLLLEVFTDVGIGTEILG